MSVKREKVHFETVEELLGAPTAKDTTTEIRINQIYKFEKHPFKVLDDAKMADLVQSIKDNGVIVPVLVRPDDEGTYEMISGHRRMHAAKLAGLTTIPAIIKPMTNDEATIAMVDANMQREELLPSERAYSLNMKMEAMRRQGARTDLMDETSATEWRGLETAQIVGMDIGLGKSQVKKYIRLTELIPELMELVDQKRLSIVLSVDISYLNREVQMGVYKYFKQNGMILKEQIEALKEQENADNLTEYTIGELMNNAIPAKKDTGRIILSKKKLDQFFPSTSSSEKREEIIIRLLNDWKERSAKAYV